MERKLKTFEYRGVVFGAAKSVVDVDALSRNAIELKAGVLRAVLPVDQAVQWLVGNGLPLKDAEKLIAEASKQRT